MLAWLYLALIQVIAFVGTVLGIVILFFLSIFRCWKKRASREYPYDIMAWSIDWIDRVYGNEEDGIDGSRGYRLDPEGVLYQHVWIERTKLWPEWLQVYWWSAWRNSDNNLRFVFRWIGGPFIRREWMQAWPTFHKAWKFVTFTKVPWYFQCGWNDRGFPVVSGGKI